MDFDFVHRARIKREAADSFSQLLKKGEDCNPMDDALPFMLVSFVPKDERKRRIKPNNVTVVCNNSDTTTISPGLNTISPIKTPRAETTRPALTELLKPQAKDALPKSGRHSRETWLGLLI